MRELGLNSKDLGRIKTKGSHEDPLHLVLKALIGKILDDKDRNWSTEVPFDGQDIDGSIDFRVHDVRDFDEEKGYEVQKKITEEWKKQVLDYPIDTICISQEEYESLTVREIYEKLKKEII